MQDEWQWGQWSCVISGPDHMPCHVCSYQGGLPKETPYCSGARGDIKPQSKALPFDPACALIYITSKIAPGRILWGDLHRILLFEEMKLTLENKLLSCLLVFEAGCRLSAHNMSHIQRKRVSGAPFYKYLGSIKFLAEILEKKVNIL